MKKVGLASAALVAAIGVVSLGSPHAYAAAQTCTWVGTASDSKFSTAANWSNCNSSVPQAGDIIQLNASSIASGKDELVNDLGVDFGGVQTNNDTPSGQTPATYAVWVSSLSIADGGYISTLSPSGNTAYGLFVGDRMNSSNVIGKGNLEIRGYYLGSNYDIAGTLTVAKVATSDESYIRILPGSKIGAIRIAGTGTVIFGDQTKDVTTLNPSVPITVESGSTATLFFNAACAELGGMGGSISVACNIPQQTTFNYSGNLTIQAPMTFQSTSAVTVNMTGTVTGSENITRGSGSGALNIGSAKVVTPVKTSSYTGDKSTESITVVENETATLEEGAVRASVMVEYGGVLRGKGVLQYGLIVSAGATVAPGMSPGCLTSDTLSLNGTYQFELGGTVPCTGYDQLIVKNAAGSANAVALSNTSSVLATSRYNNYTPKKGQVFVIINQEGSAAVQGTFKGLPEGATFTQNGVIFKISYKGGDGNDVTLTVMNQPTAPNTGFAVLQSQPVLTGLLVIVAAGVLFLFGRKLQSAKRS